MPGMTGASGGRALPETARRPRSAPKKVTARIAATLRRLLPLAPQDAAAPRDGRGRYVCVDVPVEAAPAVKARSSICVRRRMFHVKRRRCHDLSLLTEYRRLLGRQAWDAGSIRTRARPRQSAAHFRMGESVRAVQRRYSPSSRVLRKTRQPRPQRRNGRDLRVGAPLAPHSSRRAPRRRPGNAIHVSRETSSTTWLTTQLTECTRLLEKAIPGHLRRPGRVHSRDPRGLT